MSTDRQLSGGQASRRLGDSSPASVAVRLKTHFNRQHMLAAAYFARKAFDIESNHTELVDGEPFFAHRGYVTGAVLSTVASLEATINELYIDAQNANSPTFQSVDQKVPGFLAAENWQELERKPILDKYQKALSLTGKPEFVRGDSSYQNVDSLIKLRDALVHYKPEWDTDQEEHKKIESRLKSRFPRNPFAGPNDAFFPKKCLGHGCAEWAVKSSTRFVDDFFSKLGIPSIFSQHQQELRTQ
jgi:hypothetical protein